MIRVKNKLNQPQMIGGRSLPADGEFTVRIVDDELLRLEDKGLISIIEPVEAEADKPRSTVPTKQAEPKEGEKK